MTYSRKTKEQARKLRKKGKYLSEIASQLDVSVSSVHEWVQDLELPGRSKEQDDQLHFARSQMQRKYANLRREAYDSVDPSVLHKDTLMRDFTVMYMAEGYRRSRNKVQICNTDALIMRMAMAGIERLQPQKTPDFKLKIYPDHKPQTEKRFWAAHVGIKPSQIKLWEDPQKSKPTTRRRSEHGILYASWSDTYLRAKIQALMDAVKTEWKEIKFL